MNSANDRTPSLIKDEWQELLDNTTAEWTTVNGVYGRKYTATNGNSLFLPAAGRCSDEVYNAGSVGHYWSASLYEGGSSYAWHLYFGSGGHYVYRTHYRYYGFSVRAVRSQN